MTRPLSTPLTVKALQSQADYWSVLNAASSCHSTRQYWFHAAVQALFHMIKRSRYSQKLQAAWPPATLLVRL